ncbi:MULTISPECIES: phage holin family protein [unclassified Novosphingobium]|uniref:phage holin family protein n=1 Tax=unclassified Novosphingobium TaxID=2644732 RepID=UPI0025DF154E|nr:MULTISPECIES: phage holin family protein [unclassified Novosphingobium]HQV02839.1 phage holin family protein [Novosphingobium sp.]
MADESPPLIEEDAAERSLVADVRQLVEDGRTLLEAELAYQKSRAMVAGQAAKGVAGWMALALALLFFALMALVLGLILTLVPALGAIWATVAVVLGLLAMGALSGWVAVRRWQRAAALMAEPEKGS